MRSFARFGTFFKKNVKNTHEGVLLLVKLQAKTCNFTKSNTLWVFSYFLNCRNGTKLCNTSHIEDDVGTSKPFAYLYTPIFLGK